MLQYKTVYDLIKELEGHKVQFYKFCEHTDAIKNTSHLKIHHPKGHSINNTKSAQRETEEAFSTKKKVLPV